MIQNLLFRLRDPATYAGLTSLALGLGELSALDNALLVAVVSLEAGAALASLGFPALGAVAVVVGLLTVVWPRRGR